MGSDLFNLVAVKLLPLHEEVFHLSGTDLGELTQIEEEFRHVQELLGDDVGKEMNHRRLRKWLGHLTDAAEATEDAIDNFLYNTARWKRRGFMGCAFIFNFMESRARHKFIREIQHMKKEISRISHSMPEEEVVGFDQDFDELLKWLTEENDNYSRQRREMCIIGPPGAGKTTVAKKVYNSSAVEHHFPRRVWVGGIQYYTSTLTQVTMKITGCPQEEVVRMTEEGKVEKIYDTLKGQRYLVVLDINLHDGISTWNELKAAFPDEMIGSRIVITVNDKKYAISEFQVHQLGRLSSEDSWKLFLNTFDYEELAAHAAEAPIILEELGLILEELGLWGLPSFIVNVGALLSMIHKRRNELEDVFDHVRRLQQVPRTISIPEIASKYNCLPRPLKLCFLYCSLFPRGFEIAPKRLVQLWLTEGLIPEGDGDLAKHYLYQLVGLNMLQAQRMKRLIYGPKKCLVDTIAREFSIMKASHYNLCKNIDDEDSSIKGSARRLAFHSSGIYELFSKNTSLPNLRSLLCFPQLTVIGGELSLRFISDLKLVRVLDLEDMYFITVLPKEIGELAHLKYLSLRQTSLLRLLPSLGNLKSLETLNLRSTPIDTLPSSLSNLENLQTLDIRDTRVTPIPTSIQDLKRLQYLYMDMDDASSTEGDSLNVSSLDGLRVLSVIRAGRWMEDGLGKLTSLRKLGIYGNLDLCGDIHSHLHEMRYLKSLRLGFGFGHTIPNLERILDLDLYTLYLERRLHKLPDRYPTGLTKLCLKWSQLEQDPMATLEKLPELEVLKLHCGSFLGKEMVCSENGFRKLLVLEFVLLDGLEEWKVEREAMPRLKRLVIRLCTRLKMLPWRLQDLHFFEELELAGMGDAFKGRLQQNVGEEWAKIKHVKSVTLDGIQMGEASSSSSTRQVTDGIPTGEASSSSTR